MLYREIFRDVYRSASVVRIVTLWTMLVVRMRIQGMLSEL
jgi:hypothetical protein